MGRNTKNRLIYIQPGFILALVSIFSAVYISQGCGEAFTSKTDQPGTAAEIDHSTPTPGPTPPPAPVPPPVPPPSTPPPTNNSTLRAFDDSAVYTSQRFVSVSGNDQNAGTRESPFRTIQRAAQGIAPGTEIILLAGTYPALGSLGNLTGTRLAPIKIRGEGQVIVNATSGPTGLSMSDPRYVVVENITIQNSPIHGMNIDDGGTYATPGDYFVLRNIRFLNIGSGGNNDCLKMSGINNFFVEDSTFDNCRIGEAIDMVGCHDGVVTGNTFQNIPQHAVQAKGGSQNVLFHGNIFRDIAGHALNLGGSTDPNLIRPITAPSEGIRIRAVANIIERALAPAAFIACSSCEFNNNTIINPNRWVVRILQGGSDGQLFPSRDGVVYNNIIVFRSAQISTFVNIGPGTLPATFSFANNLWNSTDNVNFSGANLGEVGAELTPIVQQDPRFLNMTTGDYRLGTNSPAIQRGRALPTTAPVDFLYRNYLTPPSLGAYEVGQN